MRYFVVSPRMRRWPQHSGGTASSLGAFPSIARPLGKHHLALSRNERAAIADARLAQQSTASIGCRSVFFPISPQRKLPRRAYNNGSPASATRRHDRASRGVLFGNANLRRDLRRPRVSHLLNAISTGQPRFSALRETPGTFVAPGLHHPVSADSSSLRGTAPPFAPTSLDDARARFEPDWSNRTCDASPARARPRPERPAPAARGSCLLGARESGEYRDSGPLVPEHARDCGRARKRTDRLARDRRLDVAASADSPRTAGVCGGTFAAIIPTLASRAGNATATRTHGRHKRLSGAQAGCPLFDGGPAGRPRRTTAPWCRRAERRAPRACP